MGDLIFDGIRVPYHLALSVCKIRRSEAVVWNRYHAKYGEWPTANQINCFLADGFLDVRKDYTEVELSECIEVEAPSPAELSTMDCKGGE